MDGDFIHKVITSKIAKPYYRGIYSANNLISDGTQYLDPNALLNLFICNSAKLDHPGIHWIAIGIYGSKSITNNRIGVFLDSFGRDPSYYKDSDFGDFLAKYCDSIRTIPYQIQDGDSSLCGVYVIYFCHMIAR